MHPAEIQAVLKMSGHSQTSIADLCDVSKVSVGQVIKGVSRSQRIEACIATVTKLHLSTLWPQWYPAAALAEQAAHYDVNALSTDELELLRDYRSLSAPQREQARAMLKVLRGGGQVGGNTVVGSGRQVIANAPGARAAGGGSHVHYHTQDTKSRGKK